MIKTTTTDRYIKQMHIRTRADIRPACCNKVGKKTLCAHKIGSKGSTGDWMPISYILKFQKQNKKRIMQEL